MLERKLMFDSAIYKDSQNVIVLYLGLEYFVSSIIYHKNLILEVSNIHWATYKFLVCWDDKTINCHLLDKFEGCGFQYVC